MRNLPLFFLSYDTMARRWAPDRSEIMPKHDEDSEGRGKKDIGE